MSHLVEDLNEQQRQTVQTLSGPLLVLAGAGSGKTRVLTRRIANLIENGVPPHRIIAVTFTNKAAREMKERVDHLLGESGEGLWMGTFHSIAARLLRMYGQEINIDPHFVIYDSDDQKSVIKRLMKDRNIGCDASVLKNTIALFENFRRGKVPQMFAPWDSLWKAYCDSLTESKAVDFTGLIEHAAKLDRILPSLWDHVLVDEFQDTSNVQFEFLRKMVSPERNICVVGDDDQSIYSWRGANPEYLLKFGKEFPGACIIKMEENYRSTGNIIRAASSLISRNTVRHSKTLRTRAADGEKISLVRLENGRDESRWIINRIQSMISQGIALEQIAVLYRINALSRSLEEELTKNNIYYRLVGGLKFYERAEIKDIIAYLRLAVSKDSENDILRVINTPRRGVGGSSLEKIREQARGSGISLWKALESQTEISGSAKKGITEFRQIVEELSSLAESEHPIVAVTHLLEVTDWLGFRGSDEPEDQSRVQNMIQLQQSMAEHKNENPSMRLAQYLDEISLMTSEDQTESESGVSLMTIHSAKGLEFDYVFLPGWEDGVFPMKRKDEETNLEEERRLAYVSITRARRKVIISCVKERSVWGPPIPMAVSPFMTELPFDCIAWEGGIRAFSNRDDSPEGFRKIEGIMKNIKDYALSRDQPTARPAIREVSPTRPGTKSDKSKVEAPDDGLSAGTLVSHVKFGQGRVVSVVGEGKMRKAIVKFSNGETKVIVTSFLTRV